MEDNLASAIEASGSSGVDRAHGTTRNDRDTQVAYHGIEGQKALPDFTVGGSAQIPIDLTADDDDLPIITETRSRPTKRKTLGQLFLTDPTPQSVSCVPKGTCRS